MPRPVGSGRGAEAVTPGGSRTLGGVIIVFMSLDELRLFGPLGLRIWLKVNRPPAGPRLRPGTVVEFDRGGHQTAVFSGEG